MSFAEAAFLVLPPWIIVALLVVVVVKLAAELRELRLGLARPIEPMVQWRPAERAIVHDYQTEEHEHESVTARAARTWG